MFPTQYVMIIPNYNLLSCRHYDQCYQVTDTHIICEYIMDIMKLFMRKFTHYVAIYVQHALLTLYLLQMRT